MPAAISEYIRFPGIFRLAIFVHSRERSIPIDFGLWSESITPVPPHFPWKKKKKRSVVGSEINFGAPYLANALKSVGEPVERVTQGGTAQPQYTVYIQRSSM